MVFAAVPAEELGDAMMPLLDSTVQCSAMNSYIDVNVRVLEEELHNFLMPFQG